MNRIYTNIKDQIQTQLADSIALILLKNSSLTPAQFETLLIQLLTNESEDKVFSKEEKTHLRNKSSKITRGSFNRTLSQARRNIVQSLYTVFLLGYTGIFDTPELEPFVETATRIKAYATQHRSQLHNQHVDTRDISMSILQDLKQIIEKLATGATGL